MINHQKDIIPLLPGVFWAFPRYRFYCHFGHELLLLEQDGLEELGQYMFSKCEADGEWAKASWRRVQSLGLQVFSGLPGLGGRHLMGNYVEELQKRAAHATPVAVSLRGRCME
jgi:hypothetical protein